jgi:hypothetical protein
VHTQGARAVAAAAMHTGGKRKFNSIKIHDAGWKSPGGKIKAFKSK